MNPNNLPTGLPSTPANVAHEVEQEWSRFVQFTIGCDEHTIEAGVVRLAVIRRRNLDSTDLLRPATLTGLRFWLGW